jgi:hypothetical protein
MTYQIKQVLEHVAIEGTDAFPDMCQILINEAIRLEREPVYSGCFVLVK